MVYILAASSVHHAIDVLSSDQQSKHKNKVYANLGLIFSPKAKNPRKILQNLFSKTLKDKTEFVVWHDVLNNSICRHKSTNFRPLSVPDLINELAILQNNFSPLAYCQRDSTPDTCDSLEEL